MQSCQLNCNFLQIDGFFELLLVIEYQKRSFHKLRTKLFEIIIFSIISWFLNEIYPLQTPFIKQISIKWKNLFQSSSRPGFKQNLLRFFVKQ